MCIKRIQISLVICSRNVPSFLSFLTTNILNLHLKSRFDLKIDIQGCGKVFVDNRTISLHFTELPFSITLQHIGFQRTVRGLQKILKLIRKTFLVCNIYLNKSIFINKSDLKMVHSMSSSCKGLSIH